MKVTFVDADDWVALYVDGELKAQGHSIPRREMMEALSISNWEELDWDDLFGDTEGYAPLVLEEENEGNN